jgi:hypothetical protein
MVMEGSHFGVVIVSRGFDFDAGLDRAEAKALTVVDAALCLDASAIDERSVA